MSQASKTPIKHGAHFGFTGWTSVLETLIDISTAVFFRVEFWKIGWQEFHLNFRLIGKVSTDFFTGMNTSSIPNQNDLAWNMPLQMLESLNDLLAFDRSVKVSYVRLSKLVAAQSWSRKYVPVIGDHRLTAESRDDGEKDQKDTRNKKRFGF